MSEEDRVFILNNNANKILVNTECVARLVYSPQYVQ